MILGEQEFYNYTGCVYKCTYRKYSARQLFDSNFDSLKYTENATDNATLQVSIKNQENHLGGECCGRVVSACASHPHSAQGSGVDRTFAGALK